MSQQIKFVQYNIWESKRVREVEAFLRDQKADVITLQEVTSGKWYEDTGKDAFVQLKKNLKLNGVYVPTVLKKKNGLQGNAILSRFPIESYEVTFLSGQFSSEDEYQEDITKEPRAVISAEVEINGTKLNVLTTHLTFSPYFNPSNLQLSQTKNLLKVLKRRKREPLIFAGDLNTRRESEIIRLLEAELTNVLHNKDFLTFARQPFEFEDFKVEKLEYLLDYIFVSDLVKVVQVETVDVDGSDHLPLVATVEF